MSTNIVQSPVRTLGKDGGAVTSIQIDYDASHIFDDVPTPTCLPWRLGEDRGITISTDGSTTVTVTVGTVTAADVGKLLSLRGTHPAIPAKCQVYAILSPTSFTSSIAIPLGSGTTVLTMQEYLYATEIEGIAVKSATEFYNGWGHFDPNLSRKDRAKLLVPANLSDPNNYSYGPCIFVAGSPRFTVPGIDLANVNVGDFVFAYHGTLGWILDGARVVYKDAPFCIVDRPALISAVVNAYPPVYFYPPVTRSIRKPQGTVVVDWIDAWAKGGTLTGLKAYMLGGFASGSPIGSVEKTVSAGGTARIHAEYSGGLVARATTGWPVWWQLDGRGSGVSFKAQTTGTPTEIHLRVGFHEET